MKLKQYDVKVADLANMGRKKTVKVEAYTWRGAAREALNKALELNIISDPSDGRIMKDDITCWGPRI